MSLQARAPRRLLRHRGEKPRREKSALAARTDPSEALLYAHLVPQDFFNLEVPQPFSRAIQMH